MTGAYTAKPEDAVVPPDIPDGWPPTWPHPGPLPPGYTPNYVLTFVDPTPDDVGVSEEIEVRVRLKNNTWPTIEPTVDINWEAVLEEEIIALSSTGWTYSGGFWGSSWTFTPPLEVEDVTEPPKVMTVYADGIMDNGSHSIPISADEGIDVVEKLSFIAETSIDSYVVSGSPASWYAGAAVTLGITGVGYWSRTWRVDKDNETFHEHIVSNSGTLPEGIVWTQDIPNRKLILTIPKDSFDPAHEYYILTSSDSTQSLGSLTINISTRVQLNDADDTLLSEMNASGSGSVPPNSSFVEVSKYDVGGRELSLDGVLGLFSGAIITNY